jgi:hypothetical protein
VDAFIGKQANFIGSTGYSWGDADIVALGEQLMVEYTSVLYGEGRPIQDTSSGDTQSQEQIGIGTALAAAKRHYAQQAASLDNYDAKTLMQTVLYGLPMYNIQNPAAYDPAARFDETTISWDIAPPISIASRVSLASLLQQDESNVSRVTFEFPDALDAISTSDGSAFLLEGSASFMAGEPIQPLVFAEVNSDGRKRTLRGAILRTAVYTDIDGFDPIIAQPDTPALAVGDEPAFSADGWFPSLPFVAQADLSLAQRKDNLVVLAGQYNQLTQTLRQYSSMTLDVYVSESADTLPPRIIRVDGVVSPVLGSVETGSIKVEAEDLSGVAAVVVSYFEEGAGTWQSVELQRTGMRWSGEVPASTTAYIVQVVDEAGNVAYDTNNGRYHELFRGTPMSTPRSTTLYLPLVMQLEQGER